MTKYKRFCLSQFCIKFNVILLLIFLLSISTLILIGILWIISEFDKKNSLIVGMGYVSSLVSYVSLCFSSFFVARSFSIYLSEKRLNYIFHENLEECEECEEELHL